MPSIWKVTYKGELIGEADSQAVALKIAWLELKRRQVVPGREELAVELHNVVNSLVQN